MNCPQTPLPVGWRWDVLGNVLEGIEAGKSPKAQERGAEPNELGVLKVSSVTWGQFRPEENKAILPDYNPGSCPRVCKGDLLISRANTVELVGAVAMAEKDYPNLLLSDKTLRLIPCLKQVSPRYLLYALRTPLVRHHLESHATGTSGSMRNISQVSISTSPIPLPPLLEQRRIAAILDKADAIRRKRQEALALTDEFLRSAFLDMFGDPVTNPKGWPVGSIDIVVKKKSDVRCGPFGTQLKVHELVDSGIPLFGTENVHNNQFIPSARKYLTERKASELSAFSIRPGDVLVTRMGTIGRACVVPQNVEDGRISYHLFRVRPDEERCLPEFLASTICRSGMFQTQLRMLSHGAIMAGLSTANLRAVKFLLPPISLQKEYLRYVLAVENMMSQQSMALDEVEALFKSLQQRAFCGKL